MLRRIVPVALLVFLLPFGVAESTDDVTLRFSYEEGVDNIPPGCQSFQVLAAEDSGDVNPCHAIATSMNKLDSPKIDVLIMAPASPTVERDIRILRQSTQMWEDGLKWMAADMGLHWLADTLEFRISTQIVDEAVASGFVEYGVIDPEIVLIASNPAGGLGIGFDPQYFAEELVDPSLGEGPCHGIQQPFNFAAWQARSGFDDHHGESGTYVEDCDGAGGNICFSVNGAIDPAPGLIDFFQLYDLASHETGHCLTLGHVGDGAEGAWATVPTNDIMAYSQEPLGLSKCVSSLDVEGFVMTMSKYIDTNGDGQVDETDVIWANDAVGDGDPSQRPFMIQHPDNHYYASPTRAPQDCPQPDFSPVPLSEVTNFTPTDFTPRAFLRVSDRIDGDAVAQGIVNLQGIVAGDPPAPVANRPLPQPWILLDDEVGDSEVPHYDILSVNATVTETTLQVTVEHADLRPDEGDAPAPQYSLGIDEATFYAWGNRDEVSRDMDAGTITYTFSREELAAGVSDHLATFHVLEAPYEIRAWVYAAPGHADSNPDYAPEMRDPPLLLGDPTQPADAHYVLLQAGDAEAVKVPIGDDGTWSGNLDLGVYAPMEPVAVAATWHTASGYIIDSDRVLLVVDPTVSEDASAIRSASAGPGSGEENGLPALGPLGLLVGVAAARAIARRRG